MTTPPQDAIAIPPGVVCVTTWGKVEGAMAQAKEEMRAYSERQGLQNVGWTTVPGTLVEKARNDAVRIMLSAFEGHARWLLFVDGDMVPPADALIRILTTAYKTHPWADVVGAYCALRGEMALPTIDTGTGTWESIYPGRGVLEVMRTGAAFVLIKRHVYERLKEPWYRTRSTMRALDFMLEVDNHARIHCDGRNPLRDHPAWKKLEDKASADPSAHTFTPIEVGEDSNFCDRVKQAGMRIVVDTNLEIPHLDTTIATWRKHKEAMEKLQTQWLQAVGVS